MDQPADGETGRAAAAEGLRLLRPRHAEHEEAVRRFYEFLRVDCGIDAVFDRVAAQTPQEWTAWMIRTMTEADFVLCVVSPDYKAAADAALPPDVRRGAQWETRILREWFNANEARARARVLPMILPGRSPDEVPIWIGPTTGTHYRVADLSKEAAANLLRYLIASRSTGSRTWARSWTSVQACGPCGSVSSPRRCRDTCRSP